MLAGAGPREYADCLRSLLDDEGVDGVMVILPPPPVTTAAEVAGAIIPVIRSTKKPVVIALMGEDLIAHAATLFRGARVPDYRFPERAASALRVLHLRSNQLQHLEEVHQPALEVDQALARTLLEHAERGRDRFLDAQASLELVGAYGIPVSQQQTITTHEEAQRAAAELGYPVVMKISSPDVPHKSDLGGVLLNLQDGQAVGHGYSRLMERMQKALPGIPAQKLILQPQAPPGQDVIVGFVRDPQFGPLLMFGSGGVEVEALADVAFALAPLTRVRKLPG